MKQARLLALLILYSTAAFAQGFTCSNGTVNATNPTEGKLISCTLPHQEFLPAAPVTLTRTFGVYIPVNYVPGLSGMIVKILGTTHRIGSDCSHASATTENAGWLYFLDNLPAPAPVLVCPQGLVDTMTSSETDPGERWNSWGFDNTWNWKAVTGSDGNTYSGNRRVKPNDDDFIVQVTEQVQTALQTDPTFTVLNNDHIEMGGLMAYQLGANHPGLYNAVVMLEDPFGIPNWTGSLATGYVDPNGVSIPSPAAPISVMIIVGQNSSGAGMCGGAHTTGYWGNLNDGRSLTIDNTIAYFNSTNNPDTFTYEPSGGAQTFCKAVGHSQSYATGLWRYVATNSTTGAAVEVWNLYYDRNAPYCSFGEDGSVIPKMCASSNPPVDWRLVNTATHTPGNPYADTRLGFSLLPIEYNFMVRSKKATAERRK